MSRPRLRPVIWRPPPIPDRARKPLSATPMPAVRQHDVGGTGPEDVALDSAGRVYTGLADGRIVRVSPEGSVPVADTGGRPLGIEVDRDDTLVVCDAVKGLLRVDPGTGTVRVIVAAGTTVGNAGLRVCNNASIGPDGSIFVSDSSQRFALEHWKGDLLEHSGTGRLLRVDPAGGAEVLLDGLHFANGVSLSADSTYVVVAETGAYRLTRLWLTGARAGQVDRLVDNLPAFPDNIAGGSDGLLWIAMGSPRNALLDLLSPRMPALRRAVWALPEAVQPKPVNTAWVLAVDGDGRVVHDLQATVPGFSMVTGVREHHGTVWMGSLHGGVIAAFVRGDPADSADPASSPAGRAGQDGEHGRPDP